jgi:transglutaminase-like putative cysteine protease
VCRRDDPLQLLYELNSALYESFDYVPKSTKVDSPIDDAIRSQHGVCQDFAHIMIALVRTLHIPCRYVSGYLHRRTQDHDRSTDGATHAWVEAFLPQLGWVGFDPTNNLVAGDRHIRTAIGRDYADVPPTKGVFRGETASELSVAVRVTASDVAPDIDQGLPVPEDWSVLVEKAQEPPPKPPAPPQLAQQQQQQQ